MSTRVWIARVAAQAACAALVLILMQALAPLAPAHAASFINTAVPTNTGLASGLQLYYSFDKTKVSGGTVTDESGNGKSGTWGRQIYVDDVFSAYTYTGNGGTQTINNGIDLAGQGGLVWTKDRNNTGGSPFNHLYDSTRAIGAYLVSELAIGNRGPGIGLSGFTSSGFSLSDGHTNSSGALYASWTFRKAPKFFDIVTYTGNGANRTIAHNLGVAPGMILVRRTDIDGDPWMVYQNSIANTENLVLNTTAAKVTNATAWNSTTATASVFSLGTHAGVNASGGTYVAYVFAHDTSANGIVQAGSFTTAPTSGAFSVTLGWEPQYVIVKSLNAESPWWTVDSKRDFVASAAANALVANTSNAESVGAINTFVNATGFSGSILASEPYIYLAIRRPNKPVTNSTQVYNAIARTGTGAAETTTAAGWPVDLVFTKKRSSTALTGTYFVDRLRGKTNWLDSSATTAETSTADTVTGLDVMTGIVFGADATTGAFNTNTHTYVDEYFRRAPGVFDVVAYTGTGSATTVAHNLGAVPEMMIVKERSSNSVVSWDVYHAAMGNAAFMQLSVTDAKTTGASFWNSTTPTGTVFSLGGVTGVNANGVTHVAYLFASKAGISKVGSYTGNGTSLTLDAGFTTGSRYVMIKRTDSTGDWFVWDSTRGIVAGNDPHLSLNTTVAEVTTDDSIDPDNSGFIVNQLAATNINVNNATYIYLAFAADNGASPLVSGTSGTFVVTPGKIGQAIKFDGSIASTTVGSVSSTVKTVAFWVKPNSTTAQSIMDLDGASANIKLVSGTVTANGFTSPTIYVDGAVTSTLNNKNWHHVVVTTATAVNASSVSLGAASSAYFSGTLDDLRMYNRALSASDVTRLYGLGN